MSEEERRKYKEAAKTLRNRSLGLVDEIAYWAWAMFCKAHEDCYLAGDAGIRAWENNAQILESLALDGT